MKGRWARAAWERNKRKSLRKQNKIWKKLDADGEAKTQEGDFCRWKMDVVMRAEWWWWSWDAITTVIMIIISNKNLHFIFHFFATLFLVHFFILILPTYHWFFFYLIEGMLHHQL